MHRVGEGMWLSKVVLAAASLERRNLQCFFAIRRVNPLRNPTCVTQQGPSAADTITAALLSG